ncbi:MAG: Uma2 family endonuclease [Desulfococcaceae bacterium]
MALPQTNFLSAEEYLETEEHAECKSEYYHGGLFAMSGASFNHNLIAANMFMALGASLGRSDCFVLGSDMKIEVDKARHYTYPDLSIVCGDVRFAANRDDTVTNPVVIAEILSESTKDYDRGSKFTAYRNISSLKDYLLVDQYSCHVEYFFKDEKGRWGLEEYRSEDDCFIIRSVNAEISMKQIYHRVKFSNEL